VSANNIELNERQILINCRTKAEREYLEKKIIGWLIHYRNHKKKGAKQ